MVSICPEVPIRPKLTVWLRPSSVMLQNLLDLPAENSNVRVVIVAPKCPGLAAKVPLETVPVLGQSSSVMCR